jgi:hypothetical protein
MRRAPQGNLLLAAVLIAGFGASYYQNNKLIDLQNQTCSYLRNISNGLVAKKDISPDDGFKPSSLPIPLPVRIVGVNKSSDEKWDSIHVKHEGDIGVTSKEPLEVTSGSNGLKIYTDPRDSIKVRTDSDGIKVYTDPDGIKVFTDSGGIKVHSGLSEPLYIATPLGIPLDVRPTR